MPKVSVIIPVFGVELYIERCARSLFCQTLDDIEYIFVDDCTPDNSIAILENVLEDYPNRMSQTTILHHKHNKGLPLTRQTGISVATGEYIAHCDSDDWINSNMYQAMYEKAKEDDSDVVVCDYATTNGKNIIKEVKGCGTLDKDIFLERLLFQRDPWSLWNKLFKRTTCYRDLVYPQKNMGEDLALTLQLIRRCIKISYIPQTLYYYYQNSNSITKRNSTEDIIQNSLAFKDNVDIVLKVYNETDNPRIKNCLLYLQYLVKAYLFSYLRSPQIYNHFLKLYPTLYKDVIRSRIFPMMCKIKYTVAILKIYPSQKFITSIRNLELR